jgi:pyruvate formate lyase activating enzyme
LTEVAFIKTSLLDFPGRLASVIFLLGCDFRCPYCHNAPLVAPEQTGKPEGLVPLETFFAFLDRRKSLISGVVISGGEPLLREETPCIAASIRERGLAVKLDTNGSRPDRIAAVAADYVALDFKSSVSGYARVSPLLPDSGERVLESLAYLRSSGTSFEVRITCVPGIVGEVEIEAMAPHLETTDEVILQTFRPGGCLDPALDSVEPYSRGEMEKLLAIVRRRSPRARLRGA